MKIMLKTMTISMAQTWMLPLTILAMFGILTSNCKKEEDSPTTVTDVDGNVYDMVTIGTQVWMVQNLKTTKYRNGDVISYIPDAAFWGSVTTGATCDYTSTLSRLYNWYAVNDPRNIAPTGWHVPSDAEWTVLVNYLGGESVAGAKMKNRSGWNQNGNGSNESGFSGLPGGARYFNGPFYGAGDEGRWWSTTEEYAGVAWFRQLSYNDGAVGRFSYFEQDGYSVRCIKD